MPHGAISDRDTGAIAALVLRQVWGNFLGPFLSFLLLKTGSLRTLYMSSLSAPWWPHAWGLAV